ncbi:MAG: peptidase sortase [Ilumatobacteraceae bacterium]|nr:peptidase sortase [Ilumatobacteraceae bacterium]
MTATEPDLDPWDATEFGSSPAYGGFEPVPDDDGYDGPMADGSVEVHLVQPTGPPPPRRPLFGFRGPVRPSTPFWILISLSVVSLWCVFFAIVLSPIQGHRSQRNLYATIRSELASQTVPVHSPIASGAPIALLQIPDIGVHNLVVVEGTSAGDLENGPGHRRDTPLPGQVGVSVLMGRSLLFGAPFERLLELRTGAIISVTTGQGTFRYHVDSLRRPGDLEPQPITSPNGRLTLITSEGVGKGFDATRRTVYVDSTLIDTAMPADGNRPSAIDDSEASMRGDTGHLPDLVVWLVLLIAVVVAAQWLQARWGRRQTALVCIPVLLALLWLAAESAAQLLPNLM